MSQIFYKGRKFTIEWYFDEKGKSQSLSYFENLERSQKMKLVHLVQRMGDFGEIKDVSKFRNEGDKIFAFKPKPDRFLCFFVTGNRIIITNAFQKKQDKLPRAEKDRAIRIKEDFEQRVKEGIYYEKNNI